MQTHVPYYEVSDPFEVVYRKNSSSLPVLPHTHNALEIYFTLTDLPDVLLDDTVSSVPKGSLVIIPPYCVHQLFNQKLTIYERYIISVNTVWMEQVFHNHPEIMHYAARTAKPVILPLTADEQARLTKILRDFLSLDRSLNIGLFAEFFSLLKILDGTITDNLAQDTSSLHISKSQKTVNEIIAYINAHLMEPLTLGTIAEHFYMNKDYLGRLFKEHTQATVGHYIAVQKASLAQLLLADGMTVAQVQEQLGFSSYAYFFKFFKKMTGISPSHYRKDNYSL